MHLKNIIRLAKIMVLMLMVGNYSLVTALSERTRSFDELIALSDVVLVGTVADIRSDWGTELLAKDIFTYITFTHLTLIKGNVTSADYILRMSGGQVGNIIQQYPGAPRFNNGKTYTIFVKNNNQDLFPLVGVKQGIFNVDWDAQQKTFVILTEERRPLSRVPLKGATVKSVIAPIGSKSINLEAFISEIKNRLKKTP